VPAAIPLYAMEDKLLQCTRMPIVTLRGFQQCRLLICTVATKSLFFPGKTLPQKKVRELSIVSHVGPALVELESGGLYFTEDGQGMNIEGCIVPATEEHRTALRRRAK
jgi:hypothetical protein